MPGKYATKTEVSTEQTRLEIERVLTRYGASAFGYLTQPGQALILFELRGRRMRFMLPLPDKSSPEFTKYQRGGYSYPRTADAAERLWEQAGRSRWRALLLVIKAKLEAVEAGIVTLDEEFMSYTLLPNGQTVHEFYQPQAEEVYRSGRMPELLPGVTPLALGSGKQP